MILLPFFSLLTIAVECTAAASSLISIYYIQVYPLSTLLVGIATSLYKTPLGLFLDLLS